jgi:hypothetical protein
MGMKKPPRNKPSTKPSWMVQKGLSQGLREVFPRLGNRPFFFQRGFPLVVPATFMVDKPLLNNELFYQGPSSQGSSPVGCYILVAFSQHVPTRRCSLYGKT